MIDPCISPQQSYTTTYNTAFEKISAEISLCCRDCQRECLKMRCLAYRIDRIISDREASIKSINIDDLFEKGGDEQYSLFDE